MVSIHPHKGYLNTEFHIHLDGETPLTFEVISDAGEIPIDGEIFPNKPYKIIFKTPGSNFIKFSDGTVFEIYIEDGYRFGGSKFKNAYIFDECPWAFIIMYDRTYFYNRETKENYVEPISPDNVIEVSEDFVLFETKDLAEKMLYSLKEQSPAADISNVLHHNKFTITWIEEIIKKDSETLKIVKIFSLEKQKIILKQAFTRLTISDENLFIIYQNEIIQVSLNFDLYIKNICMDHEGIPITVIESKILTTYLDQGELKTIFIYDLNSENLKGKINFTGTLARINDVILIEIAKRTSSIKEFELHKSDFPEATISVEYTEFIFYPCEWKLFFTKKDTYIKKKRNTNEDTKCFLGALNSDLKIILKNNEGKHANINDIFCFYNNYESYVQCSRYPGGGYREGKVYRHKNDLILKECNQIIKLSANGYWDFKKTGEFDLSHYEEYNIIKDIKQGYQIGFYGQPSGVANLKIYKSSGYFCYENIIIYPGGKQNIKYDVPTIHSPKFNFGLKIEEEKIFLQEFRNGILFEKRILEGIFDYSKYLNVLLSESGNQIMFRSSNETAVLDIHTNNLDIYPNMSYIQHINGIRPFFERASSLQPTLIDPITGQHLDNQRMPEYKFISPKKTFYASTKLEDYIEYYSEITSQMISAEENRVLIERFHDPEGLEVSITLFVSLVGTTTKPLSEKIKCNRKKFILENFKFFHNKYPHIFKVAGNESQWEDIIYNQTTPEFFDMFRRKTGVVVIRQVSNDEIIAKITLNCVPEYLNYVSFSYDERYVAIACYFGRGAFILYDLKEHKNVLSSYPQRAVWNTAFSKNGLIAAYTSTPNTGIESINNIKSNSEENYEFFSIINRNFLTFSPDGKYCALSSQGYVSKYDINGKERDSWGHEPSSLVEIIDTEQKDYPLVQFTDISNYNRLNDEDNESGIADTFQSESVASVSFSKDNKKLMMVGRDGVVVIRNLKLERDAGV